MHRSLICLARSSRPAPTHSVWEKFAAKFSRSKPQEVGGTNALLDELKDESELKKSSAKLPSTSRQREYRKDINEDDDYDSIRARGVLPFRYNYEPPGDLTEKMEQVLKDFSAELDADQLRDWRSIKLDNRLKFLLLVALEKSLKHFVSNALLHEMKTAGDVCDYYQQPVSNVSSYAHIARKVIDKPENLHVMEDPDRFHPDDKDAYHGGVTAFPGTGGKVFGLRNKRLLRQYNPKKEWYDFKDQHFEYDVTEKGMPWTKSISKKVDNVPNDWRYNKTWRGSRGT